MQVNNFQGIYLMLKNVLGILLLFSISFTIFGQLAITHKQIRQDKYTFSEENLQWGEAWGELNQFYPRYFKRSSTLQLFICNNGNKTVTVKDLKFNGLGIQKVCTNANFAGPVIWYRVYPEKIPAGKSAMLTIRLRKKLVKPVEISFSGSDGSKHNTIFNTNNFEKIRIAYVGFNNKRNKVFIYVENNSSDKFKITEVKLNGKKVNPSKLINQFFADNCPAFVEVPTSPPLAYGSPLEVVISAADGTTAACQIRVRDDKFNLGIIGGNLKAYYAKMFNFIYVLNGKYGPKAERLAKLAKLNMTLAAPVKIKEDMLRLAKQTKAGNFLYGNADEPDAHEPKGLPYMQRCGINIMRRVEPLMRHQRNNDPKNLTMLMIDSTYAPLNWFTYGEVPDVYFNDIYCLTQYFGYSLKNVAPRVLTGLYASAPRPVNIMLWGCMNTGFPMRRAHTPLENNMEIHYTIASGAKGIHYFIDWNSYPNLCNDGYYIGVTKTGLLWKNIGRMNAKITRVNKLLNISYPSNLAQSSKPQQLWTKALLCGSDNLVIIAVNRKHNINIADRIKMSHVYPVKNAFIKVKIPKWLQAKKLVRVEWDKTIEQALQIKGNEAIIPVKDLLAGRMWVLSADENIQNKLKISAKRLALLKDSEKPSIPKSAVKIKPFKNKTNVILIPEDKNILNIKLNAKTLKTQCAQVNTVCGSLDEVSGHGVGLYSNSQKLENRAEILFHFKSKKVLKKLKISLNCATPNFIFCANNSILFSSDGRKYKRDCSFKKKWIGHGSLKIESSKEIKDFYVKIILKDPRIVQEPAYTNLAKELSLSWSN